MHRRLRSVVLRLRLRLRLCLLLLLDLGNARLTRALPLASRAAVAAAVTADGAAAAATASLAASLAAASLAAHAELRRRHNDGAQERAAPQLRIGRGERPKGLEQLHCPFLGAHELALVQRLEQRVRAHEALAEHLSRLLVPSLGRRRGLRLLDTGDLVPPTPHGVCRARLNWLVKQPELARSALVEEPRAGQLDAQRSNQAEEVELSAAAGCAQPTLVGGPAVPLVGVQVDGLGGRQRYGCRRLRVRLEVNQAVGRPLHRCVGSVLVIFRFLLTTL